MMLRFVAGSALAALVGVHLLGVCPAAGAEEDATAPSEQERLARVREMFESPYTEEQFYRTDRLLVSATGSPVPVHRAPAVATVITAEEIERTGATQLQEVLETVAGVHVGASSITRLAPVFSIRGIHTPTNPQVLFLLNGIPITQMFQGGLPYSFRMPVTAIARVEVIRGPGSAVHGADAFSGTVNIVTKSARDIDGTEVGGRYGSFRTRDAWLQHGGVWGEWDTALSFTYQASEGDDGRVVDSDQQSSLDSIFGTSASRAPGPLDTRYEVFDAHLEVARGHWAANMWGWMNRDAGLGDGATHVVPEEDSEQNEDVWHVMADLSYHNSDYSADWDFDARVNYVYRSGEARFELFPPGAVLAVGADGNLFTPGGGLAVFPDGVFGTPIVTDEQFGGEVSGAYTGISDHRVKASVGARHVRIEAEEEKNFGPGVIDGTTLAPPPALEVVDGTLTDVSGTAFVYVKDQSRTLGYLSVQDEWGLARDWQLTAGARYDHYSDFGYTINPRFALVWEPRHDLSAKLLYGRAFRPPSFAELHAINNPSILGNPDLDPETIDTYELALDYQPFSVFRLLCNLYWYDIDGLIEYVPDSNGSTSTAQNATDQRGYGFEVEVFWGSTDGFLLSGNFAWQRSFDRQGGSVVADAPRYQLYINPHWAVTPQWSVDGQVSRVGGWARAAGDGRGKAKPYTLVDLTLRRKFLWNHWNLGLGVRNLFDTDASEPSPEAIPDDYPLAGRSIWAEVSFRL